MAVTDDGATGVIGASGDGDPNGSGAGSAYVFTSANGTWTQQAKLSADDGDDGDDFGVSVAVAGDGSAAVVGAPNDEDPNGSAAGAAYAFTPSDGTWTQQGKLTADDGDAKDRVGVSVAISDDGTTAIIGAPNDEDPNGKKYSGADTFRSGAGAAYVFTASDGAWSQATKLAPDDGDAHDDFGTSVAISGDGATGIVGALNDENPNGANEYNNGAGSAYVFRSSSESWSQAAKLAPADGDIGDNFGASVAASNTGTTALISAPNDDGPSKENVGSAYVYSI